MTHRSSPAFRLLALLTAVVTYSLIVWGGVVRVTGSGLGCGTTDQWPLCHGRYLPPWQQDAIIEFTHRWLAAMATALVVAVAVTATVRWLRARREGEAIATYRLRTAQLGAIVVALFILQIVLGAITVTFDLPGYVIAVHLANAEFLLAALILVAARARFEGTDRAAPGRPSRAYAPVLAAAGATYVLVVAGSVVVASGAGAACDAWPLCGNGLQPSTGQLATVNLFHRLVAGVVVGAIGLAVMSVRRAHPSDIGARVTGMIATALLLAQVIVGAVVVKAHLPAPARGIHLALASALWASVVVLAVLVRAAPQADPADHPAGGERAAGAIELAGVSNTSPARRGAGVVTP